MTQSPTNTSNPSGIDPAIREKIVEIVLSLNGFDAQLYPTASRSRAELIADAILALAPSDGWQDISTARPKDRERVLLVLQREGHEPFVGEGYWRELDDTDGDGEWWWANEADGDYHAEPIHMTGQVTHWRPLPPPPGEPSNLKSEGGDA